MIRKMLLIAVCFMLLIATTSSAQIAYKQGDKIFSAGIGFGTAGLYGDMKIPPVSLGLDFGFNENISLGGIVGFTQSEYSFTWYYGDAGWTYTYIIVGGRGAYHLDLFHSEKVDTYGGLMLGYNIVSSSWNGDNDPGSDYSASSSYMIYGFYGGYRYYFKPNMAVFGELGYGIGYITVGLSLKI